MEQNMKEVFDEYMLTPNQIHKKREDVSVKAEDLLEVPEGSITEQGVRTNINVGIQYIESWLNGRGAAPIYNLMEDAATAEISRAQVWQWVRHPKGVLDNGRKVDMSMYETFKEEELQRIKSELGEERFNSGRFDEAAELFDRLIKDETFYDFLTLPAYEIL